MRNLYKLINLPENAHVGRIEARLPSISDKQLQYDVEYILLHEERRAVYDKHLDELKQIAAVRSSLNLNDTPHWNVPIFDDFRDHPNDLKGRLVAFLKSIPGSPYKIAMSLIVGSTVALLMTVFILSFSDSNAASVPPGNDQKAAAAADKTIDESVLIELNLQIQDEVSSYYIKLINSNSNQVHLTALLKPGKNLQLNIPAGIYEIKFAIGNDWQGARKLFGAKTRYYKMQCELASDFNGATIKTQTIVIDKSLPNSKEIKSYEF